MHAGTYLWLFAGIVALVGLGLVVWTYSVVGEVLLIGGGVCFVIMSIGVGIAATETNECNTKADALGRDWRYSWNAGCLVETDGGDFVPIDNLRITSEERE